MADQKPDQQRLGRYELVKLLEEGGAGSMYRARDTQNGQGVLLKQAVSTWSSKTLAAGA